MASSRQKDDHNQRLKLYRAHQIVHNTQVTRRTRDQWAAGLIMVVAVSVASLGYWAWVAVGPGATVVAEESEGLEGGVEDAVTDLLGEEPVINEDTVPDIALSEFRSWEAQMTLDGVDLELSLNGFLAPQAVANFLELSRTGFYEGVSCHRLTTEGIFVLQCGDPEGTGQGGPGYTFGPIENAPEDDVYETGSLAMARVGGDDTSMGSQFFIVYDDSTIPSDAAGGYTLFGSVTSGLTELVDEVIEQGTVDGLPDGSPVAPAEISNITIR
ncbi:peptidyl-prolyl cis-trans isomerase [Pontimonas salivibrio]|uniref:Peptidyl-prolyl cis-trans isomerase n=1 Tax=Pontimonas salivibrio TaxID=1159327 RepID=A0A2L2BR53_9MICO|nr:peptidylprolyl isomerase [Pontimonas salivibrio]AVG24082.1 peptidyl-prolyl cis-trans isomerase [Pontimonas salivibrio]